MKTISLIACITFGIISISTVIVCIIERRAELLALTAITAIVFITAYHDYKEPEC